MIGSFGTVVFETSSERVRTWRTMQRSGSGRYAQHDVLDAVPITEFIGPGVEEISLEVFFDAFLGLVPADELSGLRAMRDAGQAHDFVIGTMRIGRYCLVSVDENWTCVDNSGLLISASATLKLKTYA